MSNPSDEVLASVWEFRLFLTDDEGRVKWKFDIERHRL